MTRAAIAFLALASCAPEPTLRQVEADAVTNFVGNTCTDNREDCEFACKDEFWFPEAETHLNQCLLIVARKFAGEA